MQGAHRGHQRDLAPRSRAARTSSAPTEPCRSVVAGSVTFVPLVPSSSAARPDRSYRRRHGPSAFSTAERTSGASTAPGRSTPMPSSSAAACATIAAENAVAVVDRLGVGRPVGLGDEHRLRPHLHDERLPDRLHRGRAPSRRSTLSRSRTRSMLVPVKAIAGCIASGIAPAAIAGREHGDAEAARAVCSTSCPGCQAPVAASPLTRRPAPPPARRGSPARCARRCPASSSTGTPGSIASARSRLSSEIGADADDGVAGAGEGGAEHRADPAGADDPDAEPSGWRLARSARHAVRLPGAPAVRRVGVADCTARRAQLAEEAERGILASTAPSSARDRPGDGVQVARAARRSSRSSGPWLQRHALHARAAARRRARARSRPCAAARRPA